MGKICLWAGLHGQLLDLQMHGIVKSVITILTTQVILQELVTSHRLFGKTLVELAAASPVTVDNTLFAVMTLQATTLIDFPQMSFKDPIYPAEAKSN